MVLLVVLGVQASTIGFLAVTVICPLMMIVMMKMMVGGSDESTDRNDERLD